MKILHICYSDDIGGAAKAALRIVKAQRNSGLESDLLVVKKRTNETFVFTHPRMAVDRSILRRAALEVIRTLNAGIAGPLETPVSLGILDGKVSDWVNNSEYDLVNLHWVGNETISTKDISRIRKPLVWTCHDMWLFSGVRHIVSSGTAEKQSKTLAFQFAQLVDRFIRNRKLRLLRNPIALACPSRWMANKARESELCRGWPIAVIPNCVDSKVFCPRDKKLARESLGLPVDRKIIVFGAVGGAKDPNKGYDLLSEALSELRASHHDDFACVTFGSNASENSDEKFPVYNMGKVFETEKMATIYNAADVVVVPSRIENLPQVAAEAQSCGKPVVAFNVGGLPDVVVHDETGLLVEPYSSHGLASAISILFSDAKLASTMGEKGRLRAMEAWSPLRVANEYRELYESCLAESKNPRTAKG